MVPQALSSSGIRLQRPTPLQALHGAAVPQCAGRRVLAVRVAVAHAAALAHRIAGAVRAGRAGVPGRIGDAGAGAVAASRSDCSRCCSRRRWCRPAGSRSSAQALRVARAGVAERELRRAGRGRAAVGGSAVGDDLAVAPDRAVGIGRAVGLALRAAVRVGVATEAAAVRESSETGQLPAPSHVAAALVMCPRSGWQPAVRHGLPCRRVARTRPGRRTSRRSRHSPLQSCAGRSRRPRTCRSRRVLAGLALVARARARALAAGAVDAEVRAALGVAWRRSRRSASCRSCTRAGSCRSSAPRTSSSRSVGPARHHARALARCPEVRRCNTRAVHPPSQQTPSTQKFEPHSLAAAHAAPFAFMPDWQTPALAEHAAPLQGVVAFVSCAPGGTLTQVPSLPGHVARLAGARAGVVAADAVDAEVAAAVDAAAGQRPPFGFLLVMQRARAVAGLHRSVARRGRAEVVLADRDDRAASLPTPACRTCSRSSRSRCCSRTPSMQ